ncbi:hypothetical protein METHB2_20047 [Candidatus Methylobacter favarea]|uniref:Uncharacterized protein n=1 Tax=Candidatus Methylobacter favarea TaxID=2707345 RepID=A0A8S0W9T7_9GAMM|nr:hypothetical protein METHB2_20047 [Candidatus Methylobacter favarea]
MVQASFILRGLPGMSGGSASEGEAGKLKAQKQ